MHHKLHAHALHQRCVGIGWLLHQLHIFLLTDLDMHPAQMMYACCCNKHMHLPFLTLHLLGSRDGSVFCPAHLEHGEVSGCEGLAARVTHSRHRVRESGVEPASGCNGLSGCFAFSSKTCGAPGASFFYMLASMALHAVACHLHAHSQDNLHGMHERQARMHRCSLSERQ